MKKQILIAVFTLIINCQLSVISSFAQAPQAFKYQTIARDNAGNIIANHIVSFRIGILQGTAAGLNVYTETQTATTNQFGLANLNIGTGTVVSGSFAAVNWGSNNYFVKIEFDPTGASNFVVMGTSQLLSVPYALYAQHSANGTVGATGANGATGAIGATGSQGTIGTIGATGSTGSTGLISGGTAAGNTTFWDGTQWVLNSNNIYNNGGNVGVGTTTPSEKLDITGSIRFSGSLMPNNAPGMNGTVLQSLGANTTPIWICSPGFLNCNNNPVDGCEINITSDKNNCGFCGVSCPADKICINGICTTPPSWNLIGNGGTTDLTNFIGTTDNIDLVVKTNSLERLRVLGGGNVGIGTTSPVSKLSVGNNSEFQVSATGNITQINNVYTSFPAVQGAPSTILRNDGAGNLSWVASTPLAWSLTGNTGTIAGTNFTGTTDPVDWVVKTNSIERMRVLSGGNIGIGTTTPASKLDVEGGISIGATYSGTTASPVNGAIIEGNVGIGTTTPASKLDVEGGISIGATYSGTTAAPANGAIIEGNLGVGISAPVSALDVNGAMGTRIKTITVNTTLDNTAEVWYAIPVSGITLTLPAASGVTNRRYIIVNRSAQIVTIGSYTNLSGSPTSTIATNSSVEIISDGTNWLQIK